MTGWHQYYCFKYHKDLSTVIWIHFMVLNRLFFLVCHDSSEVLRISTLQLITHYPLCLGFPHPHWWKWVGCLPASGQLPFIILTPDTCKRLHLGKTLARWVSTWWYNCATRNHGYTNCPILHVSHAYRGLDSLYGGQVHY